MKLQLLLLLSATLSAQTYNISTLAGWSGNSYIKGNTYGSSTLAAVPSATCTIPTSYLEKSSSKPVPASALSNWHNRRRKQRPDFALQTNFCSRLRPRPLQR